MSVRAISQVGQGSGDGEPPFLSLRALVYLVVSVGAGMLLRHAGASTAEAATFGVALLLALVMLVH